MAKPNKIFDMKKIFLTMLLLMTALLPVMAQNKTGKDRAAMRREIQQYRIEFLSQEMGLDAAQKKQFEEVYNNLSEERWNLFRSVKAQKRKVRNSSNASDEDYKAAVDAMNSAREKGAAIEKKYDGQFSKFLSPKQIFKMKEADENFNRRLRKMHRERREKK